MDWWVRWLPRELRRAYGPEVIETLRSRVAEERRTHGRLRAAAYAGRALLDLIRTGAR